MKATQPPCSSIALLSARFVDPRRLHQCDSERAQREGERDEVKIPIPSAVSLSRGCIQDTGWWFQ